MKFCVIRCGINLLLEFFRVNVLIWIVVGEVRWWFLADFWLFVVLVLELRYPVLESGC